MKLNLKKQLVQTACKRLLLNVFCRHQVLTLWGAKAAPLKPGSTSMEPENPISPEEPLRPHRSPKAQSNLYPKLATLKARKNLNPKTPKP